MAAAPLNTSRPLSTQYALAVGLGRQLVGAMMAGASHDELIPTLDHCANLARITKAMQVDLAAGSLLGVRAASKACRIGR